MIHQVCGIEFFCARPSPRLATNLLQVWHFAYLILSAITKNCQTGDCQTGFSVGLCTIATEADDSVAIDSVELCSDNDSTEESMQKRNLHNMD